MFGASGEDPEGLGIVPRVLATLFGRPQLKLEDSLVCVTRRCRRMYAVCYPSPLMFCSACSLRRMLPIRMLPILRLMLGASQARWTAMDP